jgi:glucose 1-dehydrogenase
VFTSSVHEAIPWSFQSNYTASKAGMTMLMQTFAQELGPMKIRVNAVAPGAIPTRINTEAWGNKHRRSYRCGPRHRLTRVRCS